MQRVVQGTDAAPHLPDLMQHLLQLARGAAALAAIEGGTGELAHGAFQRLQQVG